MFRCFCVVILGLYFSFPTSALARDWCSENFQKAREACGLVDYVNNNPHGFTDREDFFRGLRHQVAVAAQNGAIHNSDKRQFFHLLEMMDHQRRLVEASGVNLSNMSTVGNSEQVSQLGWLQFYTGKFYDSLGINCSRYAMNCIEGCGSQMVDGMSIGNHCMNMHNVGKQKREQAASVLEAREQTMRVSNSLSGTRCVGVCNALSDQTK